MYSRGAMVERETNQLLEPINCGDSGAVGTTSRLAPEVPGSIPGIITYLCDFLKSFDRVRAGQIRSRVGVGINSDS